MKWIACLLLLGVTLRHNGANWLAESSFTPAAWFYMLGGLWEVALCAVLMWVLLAAKFSIYRDLALFAMVIGILEGLQVTGCRLLVADISKVPRGASLCDWTTGLPIGATMVSAYVLILCYGILRRK